MTRYQLFDVLNERLEMPEIGVDQSVIRLHDSHQAQYYSSSLKLGLNTCLH